MTLNSKTNETRKEHRALEAAVEVAVEVFALKLIQKLDEEEASVVRLLQTKHTTFGSLAFEGVKGDAHIPFEFRVSLGGIMTREQLVEHFGDVTSVREIPSNDRSGAVDKETQEKE